jgi:hypothetical protein
MGVMDRPFIPDAVLRAALDYVCGCLFCAYDVRSQPTHHLFCPRYRPPGTSPCEDEDPDAVASWVGEGR